MIDPADFVEDLASNVNLFKMHHRSSSQVQYIHYLLSNFDAFLPLSFYDLGSRIEVLTKKLHYQYFPKLQAIQHLKDPCDHIYFVLKGSVVSFIRKTNEEVKFDQEAKSKRIDTSMSPEKDNSQRLDTPSRKRRSKPAEMLKARVSMLKRHSLIDFKKLLPLAEVEGKNTSTANALSGFYERRFEYFEKDTCLYKPFKKLTGGMCIGLDDKVHQDNPLIAVEDTHCMMIEKKEFKHLFPELFNNEYDKVQFFKKIFAEFGMSSEKDYMYLIHNFKLVTIPHGEPIYIEDDRADGLYLVKSGIVNLSSKKNASNPTKDKFGMTFHGNKVRQVATVEPEQFFGEEILQKEDATRKYTAISNSLKTEIFFLPVECMKTVKLGFQDFVEVLSKIYNNKEKFRDSFIDRNIDPSELEGKTKEKPASYRDLAHYHNEHIDSRINHSPVPKRKYGPVEWRNQFLQRIIEIEADQKRSSPFKKKYTLNTINSIVGPKRMGTAWMDTDTGNILKEFREMDALEKQSLKQHKRYNSVISRPTENTRNSVLLTEPASDNPRDTFRHKSDRTESNEAYKTAESLNEIIVKRMETMQNFRKAKGSSTEREIKTQVTQVDDYVSVVAQSNLHLKTSTIWVLGKVLENSVTRAKSITRTKHNLFRLKPESRLLQDRFNHDL